MNLSSLLLESDTNFSAHLHEKKSRIMNIVGSIFNHIKTSNIEEGEMERMKNYAAKLSSELTIARSYIEQLKIERENSEKKLEDMIYEIVLLEKQIDRERNYRETKEKMNKKRIKEEENEEDKEIKKEEMGGKKGMEENISKEEEEEEKEEEEKKKKDNEIRIKEMEVINEKRLLEINKLNQEKKELREELMEIQLKLKNPTEEEIVNSEVYYNLRNKYELCAAKIKEIEPGYERINKEIEKLRSERIEFKEEILNEQEKVINDMKEQLSKVEQDLARVRTVRDELLSQLNVKKATELENSTVKKELMELLETRNTRISALEEQVERLNKQMEEKYEIEKDIKSEKSKEELLKQNERLEKQNKSLSSELLTLEHAFNKAHHQSSLKINEIIAKEDKFYRLNADKAKADQKYFDAMKAKDKLTIENKTLKQQNSKAGDIIIKLQEAEKITMQKLIILEKQIAILRPANESLISKVHELQLKIEEKDHNIKKIGQQISMLKQRLIEQENITSTETNSKRIAEEKVEKLKIQIQRNKNQNTVNGDIDELKIYKSMAKCSVCETKWKNTAISLCGHIFCKECINKRIETRQRRCPSCNRGFGIGDILQVHL
ncbi:hypothetical protein T552_01506 [Pneumocystis carinii B80]|uniref:E3 ubiquitin protein ligase n=1 Tax=Pneumocystis carinii (strain B80) TaxID=1408658 RepID=A0A0W4ZKI1_PNEC8|nr:hypothetical protein T552_01506 [Pneumocystis carinii B80]KTW28877.1 hypothetical protein T552_01506 [Pneumocystis carinii B80]